MESLLYVALARLVLILHLFFICFVIVGAVFLRYIPKSIWLHLPSVIWATGISFFHWPCPLTPLEKYFLAQSGYPAYPGSFIENYLLSVIYPGSLTPTILYLMGISVLVINGYAYWRYFRTRAKR